MSLSVLQSSKTRSIPAQKIFSVRRTGQSLSYGLPKKGIKSGEFNRMPVPETVHLVIDMLNGILRQRGLHLEEKNRMRDVTVDFCKRSSVKM
jgi:hypothetical protein